MNDNELNGLGRILAGILRHFPEKFNLEMDKQGWVVISSLINAIRDRSNQYHWFRPHHLLALIETDPKGRYQIRDNMIRATYGHSIDVDLDLPTDNIPDKLYYPTTKEEVELLLETGLKPSDRKKVHLSLTYEAAENAGKVRVPHPLILEIDAAASIDCFNDNRYLFIFNRFPFFRCEDFHDWRRSHTLAKIMGQHDALSAQFPCNERRVVKPVVEFIHRIYTSSRPDL